eukprot:4011205-Prymnesium_polylepis.1
MAVSGVTASRRVCAVARAARGACVALACRRAACTAGSRAAPPRPPRVHRSPAHKRRAHFSETAWHIRRVI